MSISPTSDILLDMAKAADPARARAAIARLEGGATEGGFAEALADARSGAAQAPPAFAVAPPASAPRAAPKLAAYEQLEAFFLQQFLESVLPKSDSLYGGGVGAGNWRSLMAEYMARDMVLGGGIGLAAQFRQAESRRKAARPDERS